MRPGEVLAVALAVDFKPALAVLKSGARVIEAGVCLLFEVCVAKALDADCALLAVLLLTMFSLFPGVGVRVGAPGLGVTSGGR